MSSPLPPFDAAGHIINPGEMVLIPDRLPDWLIHDLPEEDVDALKRTEGTAMQVLEIDTFGYIWFSSENETPWFCLRPDEVRIKK